MKIRKIDIENFRLLKKFSIDLEDELSLVIGKNNTGKTSLLTVLDKFINQSDRNRFSFDDFNLDYRESFKDLVEGANFEEESYVPQGIKLKIFIEYDENDDLSNISQVMMDLDPENNTIVLGFEYIVTLTEMTRLRKDAQDFLKKASGSEDTEDAKDLVYFLNKNYDEYNIYSNRWRCRFVM